jgi:glycolate oxidase iron-sulfur subunit
VLHIREGGFDAVLITASGCGTTIKDYGSMFRNDPAYAARAARISALAKDVTEYLESLKLSSKRASGLKVAYHSACSMQHGQQLRGGPKRILNSVGFEVVDVPEGHICCGSAGVYNILQPEIAGRLRERKVDNILRTKPDVVATGNIGCMMQIGHGFDEVEAVVPIVHTVELVQIGRLADRFQMRLESSILLIGSCLRVSHRAASRVSLERAVPLACSTTLGQAPLRSA